MLPTETPNADEAFELAAAIAESTDSGFAGLPFLTDPNSAIFWLYALLFVMWIGTFLITAYVIRITHGP